MPETAPSRIVLLGTENNDGTVTGVTTGTSIPLARPTDGTLTFYLRSVGTTSGGTVIVEEADWGEKEFVYSGTWSQIASISASAFTGGAQTAYHINSDNSFRYVRVRISATITGGGTILVSASSRGTA